MGSSPIMHLYQQSKPECRCSNIVVCDRWAVGGNIILLHMLAFLKLTDPPPVIARSGGVQHISKWEICKSAHFCFAKWFICVAGFSHRAQDPWGLQSSSRLSLSWKMRIRRIRDVEFYIVFRVFFLTSLNSLYSKTVLLHVCFRCFRPLPWL